MERIILENKFIYDTPNYLKQRLVNQIVENGIGTYKYKKEPNLIQLTKKSLDDKIKECINKDLMTIKLIDLLEISKGYRYSVFFEYQKLNIDLLKNTYINIESDYYKSNNYKGLDTLYLEDEEHIYIKFHSESEYLLKADSPQWFNVRYVMLFVFHKKLGLLEVRFDDINTANQKNKYKFVMETALSILIKTCELNYKYIGLDSIIRNIIEKYQDVVTELIWSGELAKSQGMTLKAGEDFIMPLFGTLNNEIDRWKIKYSGKDDAIKVLEDLESYLNRTKEYANDKFRTLRMTKYKKGGKYIELDEYIEFKVTFNYAGTMIDLINIYDIELNEMERIDYVAKLIGEARGNIKAI